MKLRHRIRRWLGIVSPSGAYPLPPRWAMSKLGRSRWYPEQPKRGLNVSSPSDVLALLASDVAAGPVPRGALTRFGTGDPEHTHGWTSAGLCGPGSGYQVNCFSQQPYGPQKGGEGSC